MATDAIDVIHNPSHSRFEAQVEGELARLDYRLRNHVMDIHHTEVPPSLGGRGIGGKLVEAAVAHARANKLRIIASCSYAHAWMQRHPQALDLLAT
ncbi:MAG: GNAT family N-acetyltransferase [Betaproteobacteria bacterium]